MEPTRPVSRSPDSAPSFFCDPRPADGVTFREVEAGLLLLNVRTGLVCELNALGARAFLHFARGGTFAALLDELSAEYDVAREVLERDLSQLVADLREKGMLEAAPSRA